MAYTQVVVVRGVLGDNGMSERDRFLSREQLL